MPALNINVFAGVSLAGFANGRGVGAGVTGLPHVLGNFKFNRQTVTIPAWHIRHAEAAQRFVFDDDVLENLVEGGADVDIAVGEGRAVMKDKFFRAGAGSLNFFVESGRFPLFQPVRFPGDEVGLHREIGARQIQCVFVVHLTFKKDRN